MLLSLNVYPLIIMFIYKMTKKKRKYAEFGGLVEKHQAQNQKILKLRFKFQWGANLYHV